jgi:forespore regulator of the sigma-K checkpoint
MAVVFKRAIDRMKKRIRRRKGWLLAGTIVFTVAAAVIWFYDQGNLTTITDHHARSVWAQQREDEINEVILHKIYICGEEYETLGQYGSEAAEQLRQNNPHWKVEGIDGGKVIFSAELEDLSPECKRNAYMGLDANGSLTLFEGKPGSGRAVRSFFQLNMEHVENSLPMETVQELMKGIRVSDYAEYNSVLSTFSDYAIDDAEQVMKPFF